jgi:clan AA aspartic protease (TIGR02281 family)
MTLAQRALRLAVALLAVAGPARAEIYRWTDAEGRVHFTERIEQVPLEHRNAARESASASRPAERVHTYSGSPSDRPAAPASIRRSHPGEIEIPFTKLGPLMRVEAVVDDAASIPFLIDTGASGISIPSAYLAKLGIRIRPDTPRVQVTTANGVVSRPLVNLRSVDLGGARVENLAATIDPGLEFGLLGGTFFNNYIYRVDAARGVMTLVANDQLRGGLGEAQWRERFESFTDPLERLEAYVREHPYLEHHEQEALAARRQQLQAGLRELEQHANELGVPQGWREGSGGGPR